jgi:predicted acylesterase/phospholipase RssA
MAIVINEIEVNVEVVSGSSGGAVAASAAGSKDEIIRECVEKVMEIINQKNER